MGLDNFQKRDKIGKVGEKIIRKILQDTGYNIDQDNCDNDGPHDIDFVASKKIMVDVKTKPDMYKKYNGHTVTGFDVKDYNKYKLIKEKNNTKIDIIFVDYINKHIRGCELDNLIELYRAKNNANQEYIVFRTDNFFDIKINENIKKELAKIETDMSEYNKRRYKND